MLKTPRGARFRPPAALAAAILGSTLLSSPAMADTTLSFSTLIDDAVQENYETYGYLARDIVGSLNSAGSSLARWGHDRLDLQNRSPLARGLYVATAFQGVYRLHWANSIYFGHEFVHFSTAHQFGRTEHWFRDDETQEKLGFGEAYLRTFLNMQVGGPAVSSGHLTAHEHELNEEEGIMSTAAGLNWQTAYSEAWLRQELTYGSKDVFDTPEFFLNRSYTASYALGDSRRVKDGKGGDVAKWTAHLEEDHGVDVEPKDVALYGFISNMLSPAYWASVNSIVDYVSHAETDVSVFGFETPAGHLTWDIPQYLNLHSMTVVPTLHLTASPDIAGALGADRLSFGAGIEVPVIGDDPLELSTSVTGTWGRIDADFNLAAAETGIFLEGGVDYNLTDHFALTAGMAFSDGETLRADRNFPFGEAAAWAGVEITF